MIFTVQYGTGVFHDEKSAPQQWKYFTLQPVSFPHPHNNGFCPASAGEKVVIKENVAYFHNIY